MKAQQLLNQVKQMADELAAKMYSVDTVAPGYRGSMSRLMQSQMLLVAYSVATGPNKAEALKAINTFAAAAIVEQAA